MGRIKLNFTPASDADTIRITRNGTNILTNQDVSALDDDGAQKTWTDENAPEGTAQEYIVYQTDAAGNEDAGSNHVSITPVSGDTTAPTITSAVIEDATPAEIHLGASEVVTGTNLGFTIHGTTETSFSSLTGSGSASLIGSLATAAAAGETITLDYDASVGDLVDGAGNALASFTGMAVTNNISSSYGDDLVMTVHIANDGDSFHLRPSATATIDATVTWGDSNSDHVTAYDDAALTHPYSTAGDYQIRVSGTMSRLYMAGSTTTLALKSIDNWGDVGYEANQDSAFSGCQLTSIADDHETFFNSTLTSASSMFKNALLATSLPSTWTLAALVTGTSMFEECSLESIHSGITLTSLVNGNKMFYNNNINAEIHAAIGLGELVNAWSMFNGNDIPSVESGVTLAKVTDASYMFYGNGAISIPSTVTFAAMTDGAMAFYYSTIPTADYDTLLSNIESNNTKTEVIFNGGNSVPSSTGITAKNALMARSPGWKVNDSNDIYLNAVDLTNMNSYAIISADGENKGIYGDSGATIPVDASDFIITNFVAGGATAVSIDSISNYDGAALTGGESDIRFNFTWTGTPDGTESFKIQPVDGASIYNSDGVAMYHQAISQTITTV